MRAGGKALVSTGDLTGNLRGAASEPVDRRARERLANGLLLLASVAVTFAVIELGFRAAMGLPVLKWEDWRQQHVTFNRLGGHAEVDPVLGWVPKSNLRTADHNTLEHGIRRNGAESTIRTGEVLAVGDSFTEGWEVDDDESWPAQLERITGRPIVNAGVGGFGTDQILLRAEQMLPIVKPKTLIIGMLDFDLERTEHTSFHAPKPWFSVENDTLQYHPPTAMPPPEEPDLMHRAWLALRQGLGYSAVVDFVVARLAPGYWHGIRKHEYAHSDQIDGVQVTCLLLERLKPVIDREKIRALLFMQYYAPTILENEEAPEDPRQVMGCARELGYEVVDHFPSLKALARENKEAMRRYYWVNTDRVFYRHMNRTGNEHAAQLLQKALGGPNAAPSIAASP